jgi:hypothetical protein
MGEKVILHWHPSIGMAGDAETRVALGKDAPGMEPGSEVVEYVE